MVFCGGIVIIVEEVIRNRVMRVYGVEEIVIVGLEREREMMMNDVVSEVKGVWVVLYKNEFFGGMFFFIMIINF